VLVSDPKTLRKEGKVPIRPHLRRRRTATSNTSTKSTTFSRKGLCEWGKSYQEEVVKKKRGVAF